MKLKQRNLIFQQFLIYQEKLRSICPLVELSAMSPPSLNSDSVFILG